MRKFKIKWRIITTILYWIVICFLVIIAGVVITSALDIPGGIKLYAVQSGSMSPTIFTGSLVISRPSDEYKKGDIITFKAEKDRSSQAPKYTTTHRIYYVKEVNGVTEYETKGDANKAPDSILVPKDLVLGRAIFWIPLLGYPVSFAKTKEGLILLVVIPATIIIYSELVTIRNEAKRLLAERRKLTTKEKLEVAVGKEEIQAENWFRKLLKKIRRV